MRILLWHVHGSWTTSFVQGGHEYLVPVLPDRGPDGRGRALTWQWPVTVREVTPEAIRDESPDLVLLQSVHEAELLRRWTGLWSGRDIPAVYLEHNAPTGHAVTSRHPVTSHPLLEAVPVVHVTLFNAMAWDCGSARTRVIEHGIVDPGRRYTGELASLAVVANEPVRRARVAGTDLVLEIARSVPVHAYGMESHLLADSGHQLGPPLAPQQCHELPQEELHTAMARHRAYLHPYRWTSLGLALIEAMTLGMPVLALSTTEAPRAVPPEAGVVTNDPDVMRSTAARWLADPGEALELGCAARRHALAQYGLGRFLDDWDQTLQEVGSV